MKRAIDWRAVDFVVSGERLDLTADEKKMVIRRLEHRMLDNAHRIGRDRLDYWSPTARHVITAASVAERMMTSERTAQRIRDELRVADKRKCPVCGEPMWVYDDDTVEAHPNRLMDECELSGMKLPARVRGLAALRPDLFAWLPLRAVDA